jgi:GT2 family glycosyltransferase
MQENNSHLLSIVIVNWNAEKLTTECIKSIYGNKFYTSNSDKVEIILIDNGSTEKSLAELKDNFTGINLISNEENLGYAVACNQGMKIAKGKYILLLGNDTILKDNSLSVCVDFLENNDIGGAVGCRIVYPDGELQGNCKKFPRLKNAFYTYLSLNKLNYDYDMLWFDYNKTMEVEQIATTFLMIRNDLLKKIGYFDEQYRILYNDVDLCKRIWDSGKKIFFLHTAEIIHHGCHSTKRADFKIRRIMYGDIFRYFRTSFGIGAEMLRPILMLRLILVLIMKNKFGV